MRSPAAQSLLNAYWIPLNFQTAALLTIAIPAMLLHLRGVNHLQTYAMLASLVGLISMVVPPLAGEISDRYHRTGTPRRPLIIAGALVNAAGLLWMVFAPDIATFTAAVVVATIGQNASQAAYSALIPEVVPRDYWGAASGYQGVGVLVGSIAGLAVAGIAGASGTDTVLYVAAAVVVVGSLTVLWVPEGAPIATEHVHVSDWRNFSLVFTSRFWTNFGLTLLGTFVLFFFSDVLKVKDASAGTSLAGVMTLVGAIVSSIAMGYVSDRIPRKVIVALAGVPMALAAIGFAAEPNLRFILLFAVLFGLGYGTIVSTGWALAIDSVPALGNVARDLGIWGIAANVPAIIAPQVGKWIISVFGAQLALGYRTLFVAAGACFLLGSAILLFAGRRTTSSSALSSTSSLPSLPPAGGPLQTFAMFLIAPYYMNAYRIRGWGRLPRRRGATLLVSNHQHDLDTTALIMRLDVQGPSMRPIYMVGSRRIFEPGFMEVRFAPIRWLVELIDWAWMYRMLGVLPIENELRRRSVASLAYAIYTVHGDLAVDRVFSSRANHALRNATTLKSLIGRPLLEQDEYVSVSTINEPYRSELIERTRTQTESDLVRIESVLRAGGTLYLTAEGKYTRDGKINRFRTAFSRVAPLGDHYLLALSYDVFAGGRLSLLYRVVRPVFPDDLPRSLAASRPVTLSQLLATWLHARSGSASDGSFTRDAALAGVRALLDEVPSSAFLDPDLRLGLSDKLDDALAAMVKRKLLSVDASGLYGAGTTRHDPRFPLVADILTHQANFYAETVAACGEAEHAAVRATASAPSSR